MVRQQQKEMNMKLNRHNTVWKGYMTGKRLLAITVYHQTAQISTENRVFSDKNSALPCRCCVDFPRKCEKNVFFYPSPVSRFPTFLRKIPGLLCLFSVICCETLHFSVYSCSHEKPQLTHHLTFFIFRNKILQPLNPCVFVIFTSFSSCAACLFAFSPNFTPDFWLSVQ